MYRWRQNDKYEVWWPAEHWRPALVVATHLVASGGTRDGQDVWGGITRFINATTLRTCITSFNYISYIFVQAILKCWTSSSDFLCLRVISKDEGCCHSIWCSQLPMVIFHWSILPPSLPPSQIAPSPLMLHNLGLSGCFWWNVTTAIYTKSYARKHLAASNKCDTGGRFLKNVRKQIWSEFNFQWTEVFAFLIWWRDIWYFLGFKISELPKYCNLSFSRPQINQDPGFLNDCYFARNVSFWQQHPQNAKIQMWSQGFSGKSKIYNDLLFPWILSQISPLLPLHF